LSVSPAQGETSLAKGKKAGIEGVAALQRQKTGIDGLDMHEYVLKNILKRLIIIQEYCHG